MAKPDWLSIEEISRLWGEETGLDAAAFKQDLEEWFSAFVKQSPASQSLITGKSADSTNRLMGMLGARYLEWQTFEAYCEERGHPKPRFWFGGRLGESRRDEPRQSEPAESEPEATPPHTGGEPPAVKRASDPELEAFQTQIAGLSERLKAPSHEFPSFNRPSAADQSAADQSAADQREPGAQRGQSGPSTEHIHQELIERAEVASAEARQLETQLEAAEQRIADLRAAGGASRTSSPARPCGPGSASPNAPRPGPTTSTPSQQRASVSYQDPSATGQRLRPRARHRGRGWVMLAAGLTVSLIALVYWGAETLMPPLGSDPIPPTPETADSSPGWGMADGPLLPAQPETAVQLSEPETGERDLGAAPSPANAQDLAAAQRRIARLTAAVEASDSVVARLRDELAIARQTVETARRTRSADAEEKLAALGTQLETARGAVADADTKAARTRAEATHLRTALQQAKGQTDAKLRDVSLAAIVSSARVAALQRDLASARQQIAGLSRDRDAETANLSSLRASLQQAEEQTEAVRQELTLEITDSSAQVATLRKELGAAQLRIAELSDAAEAAKLREGLATQPNEAAATGPSSTQALEAKAPGHTQRAVEEAVEPEVEALLSAAKNPSDPGSGGFEQVAALAPTEAQLQTDAVADNVSTDDLLLEPGRHLGQEVVVTGSVVWLLWRYRLQSNSGSDSMVVDVDGLRPADQEELEKAIDRVGILGQVYARIRGTIISKGDESYRLAASELVLVE